MARAYTKAEKAERTAHFAEEYDCWFCEFMRRQQAARTELHHIAGRGKDHEVRANYAPLCTNCHGAVQSRADAELVCLWLVKQYNPAHYSPETICRLKGKAVTCWTDADVEATGRTLVIVREYVARLMANQRTMPGNTY